MGGVVVKIMVVGFMNGVQPHSATFDSNFMKPFSELLPKAKAAPYGHVRIFFRFHSRATRLYFVLVLHVARP